MDPLCFPNSRRKFASATRSKFSKFLTDIQNAGFDQVQIRFGPQGGASVDINNTVFNQSIFNFHWNMVRSTHQLVSAMNFKMKIFFDPTPEFVGLPHVATNPAFNKYIKSMYQNYVTAFGANDIIQAFNGADLSGSIATLQIYKDVGVFPSIIAIDIYHDFDATFGRLAKVLTQFGIPKHPIFVQETFFNDERSAFEIIRAKKNYALNIRYVMNWPLSRAEDSKRRGSQVDIRSMNQYGSFASYVVGSGFPPGPIPDNFRRPDPSGITPTLISANSSGNVLRISASNLESDFRIDVRKVGNPGIDWVYFQFDDMTLLQNNFGTEITLTVNAIPILAAISNPGVEFWLVNPTSHTAVKAITVTGP